MKNLLTLALIVFSFISFSSCSNDDVDFNTDLIGVWERIDIHQDYSSVSKLVFVSDNTGISINTNAYNSGEITSSATNFDWNTQESMITVNLNGVSELRYILKSNGQLALSSSQDLTFSKVSDDIQSY
ncbi:hypothetical protein [Seonamhaeicola maritimus]|uniref:hypothetical protein n=1 Tax=Seonamhaeicola maritimus TaxID=2591822 RepID=UPI0024941EC4|nr:hypothetical protein [Seonamhaeicola maritimus]